MRIFRHATARTSAILLGSAVAIGVAATPVGGAASSGIAVKSASLPHIITMPSLQHHQDCVPPLVIAVTCTGYGTPMQSGGGPVQGSPGVYIVFWGWNGHDPSGQGAYQQAFFNGVGGSAWANSQTQYCASPSSLTGFTCNPGDGTFVGNPAGLLKGTWTDNSNPVPTSPADSDVQAEAVRAAAFFGNTSAASNASTQYVIDTPSGNSTAGFAGSAGGVWCAYHGMASSSYGGLSYTDFPYQTDAGNNCGENFVNAGSAGLLDGVSIVGGHEFAESLTDPNASTGWLDTFGNETGDKCAWLSSGAGASTDTTLSTGSFAVQSLWSNTANSGLGGCVTQ